VALRGVTLCTALAVAVASCTSGDDPAAPTTTDTAEPTSTATTVPERPASTTTTAFDPASVEGEVEAAYLRSWDVYADAVYDLDLDEPALATVYAGESLENLTDEILDRAGAGRAALVVVDHNYEITVLSAETAVVVDAYRNHQVLIDPITKEPLEADPDQEVLYSFSMTRTGGDWRVTKIERVQL
jgi:hypothetical protein